MKENDFNKSCIACDSINITFYSKYYQCNECKRKYRLSVLEREIIASEKFDKVDKIEKNELSCGYMEVYDNYIRVYDVDILWEDIKSITCKIHHLNHTSMLYIHLYFYNGEKYKNQFPTKVRVLSYQSNQLPILSVGSILFTKTSQQIIMNFFQNLKEKYNDKKVVEKIDLNNVEKVLINFRKEGYFSKGAIFLFLGMILLSIFKY